MTEQSLREEVAACIKLLENRGLIDFSGHVSARIPGTEEIIINSREQSRSEINGNSLLKVNLEGELIEGNDKPPLELPIHTSVYKARPDVSAVAHFHPIMTIALSIAGKPYIPVIYHGSIFGDSIPVYDDCRHVNSQARGDAMAACLGKGRAVIIRGHGATVAAESIKSVFYASIYLEDNAEKLYHAYAIGDPKPLYPHELADAESIWREMQFNKVWNYYTAKAGF